MHCGVGDYTAMLAKELAKYSDIKIRVITSICCQKDQFDDGVTVMPVVKKWNLFSLKILLHAVREWKPDIVHIQYPTQGYGRTIMPNILPVVFAKFGKRVVQTWHELPVYTYLANALTRDTVIVVERDYRSQVRKLYRSFLRKKRLIYIPIASNILRVDLDQGERTAIRAKFEVAHDKRLIVYFGFVSPEKGVDIIFDIAEPDKDHCVLICELDKGNSYHRKIAGLANSERWRGKVVITCYLKSGEVAKLLAAADAVVLPFLKGVSERNGSFLAAKEQGTFIITTDRRLSGYDREQNVFYGNASDRDAMRNALRKYSGSRTIKKPDEAEQWKYIAERHCKLYAELVTNAR